MYAIIYKTDIVIGTIATKYAEHVHSHRLFMDKCAQNMQKILSNMQRKIPKIFSYVHTNIDSNAQICKINMQEYAQNCRCLCVFAFMCTPTLPMVQQATGALSKAKDSLRGSLAVKVAA